MKPSLRQKFFNHLVEPRVLSDNTGTRIQARLLSVIVIVMLIVFAVVDGYRLVLTPQAKIPWLGFLMLISAFVLNHRGYYKPAAFLTTALFPLIIFTYVYFRADVINLVRTSYLITGLVFAGLFLSYRALLFLSLINTLGLIAIPYFRADALQPGQTILGILAAHTLAAVCMMAFMILRNKIEALRKEDLVRSYNAQKKAIAELHRQEAFLDRVLYTSPVVIFVLDLSEMRFTFVSKRLAASLGHPDEDELQPAFLRKYLHHDDLKIIREHTQNWESASDEELRQCQLRFHDLSGQWRIFHASQAIFNRDEKDGLVKQIITAMLDVTDRVLLEERLNHTQKMETLGRMASGVAHDLNNMLTPIIGYAGLLLKTGDPKYSELHTILKAGEAAKAITRQLLSFSRKQVLEVQTLRLNAAVNEFRQILRRSVRENIEIQYRLNATPDFIRADVFQLGQILMNLAVNAQDAMVNGGTLIIETANVELDGASSLTGLTAGSYVSLKVIDNGTGMDEQTRQKIFEPFFTTKKPGEGTGLGLATVYGIVKQHDGHIEVTSELHNGTVFTVHLPMAGHAHDQQAKIELSTTAKGWGNVLVVEDDPLAAELVCRALQLNGFETKSFAKPSECLKYFRTDHPPFRLLVTDFILPERTGVELYNELTKLDPAIRVVYMSGYSESILAHHGKLREGEALVSKPFTITTLINRINEALA